MKFSPKHVILGSMVTGGIALTAGGGRLFAAYLGDILLSAPTSPPPGLMLMVIGSAMLGFSIGYISGEFENDRNYPIKTPPSTIETTTQDISYENKSDRDIEHYQGDVSVVNSPIDKETGEVKHEKVAVRIETPNGYVLTVIDKP